MFGEKPITSKSKSTSSSSPSSSPSPSSPSEKSSAQDKMTPRHASLESSHPAAFFGKKSSASTTKESPMVSEKQYRRESVDSTATWSSTISSATTIAPKHPSATQEEPFDVFEYQTAGYLSMPLSDKAQPYLQEPPSERKGSASSSASSSGSLWSKAKNKIHKRKSPSVEEQEEKQMEKQQRKKEYEALGLEERTKFGSKGGMSMVG
ncbi:hypothetical protein QM012_004076 [Aureobasidium pullulans]|uniref:Uncharacterized protein n=1 Tax=Aureobasidium pullulans TaxID=5580 RepID=A0ABR0T6N2_AURPU